MTLYCTRHAAELRLRANASSPEAQISVWECPLDRCTVEIRQVQGRPSPEEQVEALASYLLAEFPDEIDGEQQGAVDLALRLLRRLRARRELMGHIKDRRTQVEAGRT